MDSQEILKSLSNLEQKLQGIESAKQQVERTVAAYDGAKAQLTALTNDFADIYQTLNGILDNVKNSQELVKGEVVQEADAIFNSALIYELAVLKQYAEPLLFQVPKDTTEYYEAKRLLKFLDYFLNVTSESLPNNSICREFVGGSCFKV